jgi:uncharacterized protein YgbK (DUF1537 family)
MAQQFIIIADDLTGAADTAAPFAQSYFSTVVVLSGHEASAPQFIQQAFAENEVIAMTTNTRNVNEDVAREIVTTTAQNIQNYAAENAHIYKKIDSVLRGNPVVELTALMGMTKANRVLFAPAFPAQGRLTINARHMARDVVISENLIPLFCGATDLPIVHLSLEMIRNAEVLQNAFAQSALFIADAENDDDLTTLARASIAAGVGLWCGSAGLAGVMAKILTQNNPKSTLPLVMRPTKTSSNLVIIGSQHPVTRNQVAVARRFGHSVVEMSSTAFCKRQWSEVLANCSQLPMIWQITADDSSIADDEISTAIKTFASELLRGQYFATNGIERLVVSGGDTALAVCAGLNVHTITVLGELEPGIAIGTITPQGGALITLVTKSGGFGDDHTLLRLCESSRV